MSKKGNGKANDTKKTVNIKRTIENNGSKTQTQVSKTTKVNNASTNKKLQQDLKNAVVTDVSYLASLEPNLPIEEVAIFNENNTPNSVKANTHFNSAQKQQSYNVNNVKNKNENINNVTTKTTNKHVHENFNNNKKTQEIIKDTEKANESKNSDVKKLNSNAEELSKPVKTKEKFNLTKKRNDIISYEKDLLKLKEKRDKMKAGELINESNINYVEKYNTKKPLVKNTKKSYYEAKQQTQGVKVVEKDKTNRLLAGITTVCIVALFAVVGRVFFLDNAYNGNTYSNNTTINGVNVGGLNTKDAQKLLTSTFTKKQKRLN